MLTLVPHIIRKGSVASEDGSEDELSAECESKSTILLGDDKSEA